MDSGESGTTGAEGGASRGGIVTARGTAEGLVIRLDGRVDRESLKEAVRDFMSSRRSFLEGNDVSLEWVGVRPEDQFVSDLSAEMTSNFGVTVKASRLREKEVPVSKSESPLDQKVLRVELKRPVIEAEEPSRSMS